MDAFTEVGVEEVVAMTSAQVGKSEILLNVAGYSIDHSPGPIMILQPNAKPMGESFSKDRLAAMIRDTPTLRDKVKDPKSRDSDNTLMHKKFPGGHITIAGANSPSSLASRPIRLLLCDEIERYESTSEGDAIGLANARTVTFWNRRRGYFSTPVLAGGRIHKLFDDSDQRLYFVPCPTCRNPFVIRFEHLKWREGPPGMGADGAAIRRTVDAWFECPECSAQIRDGERWQAVKQGYWQATRPFYGRAGFWLWQGMSPWVTASEIADAWLRAQGRPDEEKVVKNTVLGLPWQESGEAPDWEKLFLRQVEYDKLPRAILFLTAGADVQKDRLEIQVVGWGRGKQSWLVEYRILYGDTARPEVWEQLRRLRDSQTYEHESGNFLPISVLAVDSGYATQEVYDFVREYRGNTVVATKGYASGTALVGTPFAVDVNRFGKKLRRGVHVWPVNVSMAKSELYRWLKLERPASGEEHPPGWCHFRGQTEEFFRQLTAEVWQTRTVKGFLTGEWIKTRERNEALDTKIGARAAAAIFGLDRFTDQNWIALERQLLGDAPLITRSPVQQAGALSGSRGMLQARIIESPDPYL